MIDPVTEPVQAEEGVVQQVSRGLGVAGDGQRGSIDQVTVAVVERPQRSEVTLPELLDQIQVALDRHGRHQAQ